MLTPLGISRPKVDQMVKEITEAGFVSPPADEQHRLTIEALYYLLQVASDSSITEYFNAENRCFGINYPDNPVCVGSATVKPCLVVNLCKEMRRLQDAIKVGKLEVSVDLKAAEWKTIGLCLSTLHEEKMKMEGNAINPEVSSTTPEVAPVRETKTRKYNPALLDEFGFRLSGLGSKIAALLVAGGPKAEIVSTVEQLDPELTDKEASQRISMTKTKLCKLGHTITVTKGVVSFVKKV